MNAGGGLLTVWSAAAEDLSGAECLLPGENKRTFKKFISVYFEVYNLGEHSSTQAGFL